MRESQEIYVRKLRLNREVAAIITIRSNYAPSYLYNQLLLKLERQEVKLTERLHG